MTVWNPWHGCKKLSEGCKNCYVYRRDSEFGRDSSIVEKTSAFDMPIKKDRQGEYKLKNDGESVYTCMTSDFFIDEADSWRSEIWDIIRIRSDLHFVIITKRIDRFLQCIPQDWGDGWDNVTLMSTCENQVMADYRLPIFLSLPIKHRCIIHEPMLEKINIEKYLETGLIEKVVCGGESGDNARLCDYEWILDTRRQCIRQNVPFSFRQTGALFKKDNKIYHIERKDQHTQAKRAAIDYENDIDTLFNRLAKSKFRSSFHLQQKDIEYVREKGLDTIRSHAEDFISSRLAPAFIPKDGKQTPTKGHPVFIAQHAAALCCRGCLNKWHKFEKDCELTKRQREYIVDVIMSWIKREMEL